MNLHGLHQTIEPKNNTDDVQIITCKWSGGEVSKYNECWHGSWTLSRISAILFIV
jgi:hypothetical protein